MDSSGVGISDASTRDLLNHVVEFLGFLDFPGTLQALEAERSDKRAQVSASISTKAICRESRDKMRENMLRKYDEGKRDDFMELWAQYVPASMLGYDLSTQKIEFYLNIYFAVFPILPSSTVLVATPPLVAQKELGHRMKAFKHFLETRGSGLAHTGEFLMYYALPFVPQPELHPSFEHLFLAGWVDEQRAALRDFLESISPTREVPKLYAMFESYLNQTDATARLSPQEQSRRQSVNHRRTPPREREVLAHQMGGQPSSLGRSMSKGALSSMIADSGGRIHRPVSSLLASNARGLVPTNTSQSRLSNAKPPKYSPSHFRPGPSRIPGPPPTAGGLPKSRLNGGADILEAMPQEASDDVLVGTVEPNMAQQIAQAGAMIASLDPQSGWVVNNTEGFDEEPWGVDPTLALPPPVMLAPLDYDKIKHDILAGAEGSGDSGLAARLLQALRWRLLNSHAGADRWGVLATYIETDLLLINTERPMLPVLAGASDPLLVEETARLANALASDRLGRSYLLSSPTSVPALFQIIQSPSATNAQPSDKPPTSPPEGALTPVPPMAPRAPSFTRSVSGSGSPCTRRIRSQGNMADGLEVPEGRSQSARTPSDGKSPSALGAQTSNGRQTPPLVSNLSSPGAAGAGLPPVHSPSTPTSAAAAANAAVPAAPAVSASQQLKMRDSAALQQALVALQKLSLKRSAQSEMIRIGVLTWAVHFTQDASTICEFTLEYCCALMMNLSLRPAGRTELETVTAHLLLLCEKQLESNNEQVRTYINGTLYSALCRPSIREVARGMGYPDVLGAVEGRSTETFASQLSHIQQQLASDAPPPEEEWTPDKDEDGPDMDYDDDDGFADLSMAPESPMHASGMPQGEQLLCEQYLASQDEARTQVDAVRASMALPASGLNFSTMEDSGKLHESGLMPAGEDRLVVENPGGLSGYSMSFTSTQPSRLGTAAPGGRQGEIMEEEGLAAYPAGEQGGNQAAEEVAEELEGDDTLPPLGMGPEPSAPSTRSRSHGLDASTVLSGSVVLGAAERSKASMSMSIRQSVVSRSIAKSSLMRVDNSKPMSRPITPSLLSSSLQGHALRASMGPGGGTEAGSFVPEMPAVDERGEVSPGAQAIEGGFDAAPNMASADLPPEGNEAMPTDGDPVVRSPAGGISGGVGQSGQFAGGVGQSGQFAGGVGQSGQFAGGVGQSDQFAGGVGQSGQFAGGVGQSGQFAGGVGQSGQFAGGVGQSGQFAGGVGQSGQFAGGVGQSGRFAGGVGQSGQLADGVGQSGQFADGVRQSAQSRGMPGEVGQSGNFGGGVGQSGQFAGVRHLGRSVVGTAEPMNGSRPHTPPPQTPQSEAGLDTPNMAEANFAARPTSADIDPLNMSAPIEPPPLQETGSEPGPLPTAVVLEISGGVSFTGGKPPGLRKPPERIRNRMGKPKTTVE